MNQILDWLLVAGIMLGLFFLAYTTYRNQSLLDTVNEIKEMFRDKADDMKEVIAYR